MHIVITDVDSLNGGLPATVGRAEHAAGEEGHAQRAATPARVEEPLAGERRLHRHPALAGRRRATEQQAEGGHAHAPI